ncbi:MAG TPA: type II toxin-antitoxin system death-on-curing family toxin [Blastocatellia bacterium]|nr:type II toxin-antitoxin system death-on-curing family toxin [Blastocatellia bacterium]
MLFLAVNHLRRIQQRTIAEHGGTLGLRDEGALESAAMAVQNRFYYEEADEIACAATYAYHLSQAHAFLDGNKRIAAQATEIFLFLNGIELQATNDEIADLFLGIAASEISREQIEQQLAQWTTN